MFCFSSLEQTIRLNPSMAQFPGFNFLLLSRWPVFFFHIQPGPRSPSPFLKSRRSQYLNFSSFFYKYSFLSLMSSPENRRFPFPHPVHRASFRDFRGRLPLFSPLTTIVELSSIMVLFFLYFFFFFFCGPPLFHQASRRPKYDCWFSTRRIFVFADPPPTLCPLMTRGAFQKLRHPEPSPPPPVFS